MSAESVGAFVAALAVCLNAWSMLYLARQTKVASGQAKVGNAVAAASANDTVLGALREVHVLMLEREGMREYFYGGEPLPETGPRREAVITLAELLADVLTSGVHVHQLIPESGSAGPWADYCRHTVENSPALRHLLRAHPTWWPPLLSVLPDSLLHADAPARVPAPGSGRADA
ncbi:hypothetical protein RKD19_008152 [Streptomyces canus]